MAINHKAVGDAVNAEVQADEKTAARLEAELNTVRARIEEGRRVAAYHYEKAGIPLALAMPTQRSASANGSGPYRGLSIVEASVKVLEALGRPATTQEILDRVVAGGFHTAAKNPLAGFFGVLNREFKGGPGARVVKTGRSKWGLPGMAN